MAIFDTIAALAKQLANKALADEDPPRGVSPSVYQALEIAANELERASFSDPRVQPIVQAVRVLVSSEIAPRESPLTERKEPGHG